MKKIISGSIAVIAIVVIAAFNVSLNTNNKLSVISLANVEALADESNDNKNPCKWKKMSCGIFSGDYEACLTTGDGNTCTYRQVTRDC